MEATFRLRALVSLLLVISVCLPLFPGLLVAGQNVTTIVTTQVSSQVFDMDGTYSTGDTLYCSIQIWPDSGFQLGQGGTLSGSVSATGSVSLSIVATYALSASGKGGGCGRLLPAQLYSRAGESFQFQWTAPYSGTFYVALYNPSANAIEVSLTINYATVVTQPLYSYSSYQPPPSSETSTSYTESTQPMVGSATSSSLANPSNPSNNYLIFVVFLVAAVAGAVIFTVWYRSRPSSKPKPKITTVRKAQTAVKDEKGKQEAAFCINCGKELPTDWKFCRHCGAKQP